MTKKNHKTNTTYSKRQISVFLSIGALLFFGAGIAVSFILDMNWVDRITFIMCLGVVFLLCATVFVAWKCPAPTESNTLPTDE